MNKDDLNQLLRDYVKNNLSPKKEERDLVSTLCDSFRDALSGNCLLVGSYARFTAITPMHDADILYVAGDFDPHHLNPHQVLAELQAEIKNNFKNPTSYQFRIEPQTHSITVSFLEYGKEKFAVDVVPAYNAGQKNEFEDDIYYVPQIFETNRRHRAELYAELNKSIVNEVDWWIKSDPRGYITTTTELNSRNEDFRRTAKFVKRWKHNCKEADENFKLKSFHIEQLIYEIFSSNKGIEIADAAFKFFIDLPIAIWKPRIPDRADEEKFIDEYLNGLTESQRKRIKEARDAFLVELENLAASDSASKLLDAGFYKRKSSTESFLFDSAIPMFTNESLRFGIEGYLDKQDGFRAYTCPISLYDGRVGKDRKIRFRIKDNIAADRYRWKVKNDNSSPEPRGEITDGKTRNDPESTKYDGKHYVECYAIKDNTCIAKARVDVII